MWLAASPSRAQDHLPPAIPTAPAPVAGQPTAPFGPGAIVEFTSSGDPVSIYVARLRSDRPLGDSDFFKLGKTPIEAQLPPGTYQVEAEGHGLSHEQILFEMRGEPRRLVVSPGSEDMGVVGTLMLAVGITAIVGATAILVSGTRSEGKLDKPAILIPMYSAGGVLTAFGIGLTIASDTDIDEPPARAMGVTATLSF